jgi:hypothetical protein
MVKSGHMRATRRATLASSTDVDRMPCRERASGYFKA